MVKKGDFINFAANLEVEGETKYKTEFQVIIELAKKIKELEDRIQQLESK